MNKKDIELAKKFTFVSYTMTVVVSGFFLLIGLGNLGVSFLCAFIFGGSSLVHSMQWKKIKEKEREINK